ncbi:ABC transporter substrate-binding protein [Actinomadura sp. WMMB 499]|nr:ABC transporter substrate-binding protein [Actinomadura sp. WMMB 499]
MAWLPITQTMPLYVALEEGLFEEAGLEVELTKFENPNQIVDSLTAGQVEVGAPGTAAGITMLAEAKFPGTFKFFGLQGGATEPQRINDALVTVEDSPIRSFSDLKGKSVGTLPGIQWETITKHLVREAGLDPERDVEVVPLGVSLHIPSVVNGDVDATLSLEPVGSVADDEPGTRRAQVNPAEQYIADPFYSGASVLTTDFIEERPEVARTVVSVLDRATKMINEDFEGHKAVLAEYAALDERQVKVVAQPQLRGFEDLDETDLRSYQALVDVFREEGVLGKDLDVNDYVLTSEDLEQKQ